MTILLVALSLTLPAVAADRTAYDELVAYERDAKPRAAQDLPRASPAGDCPARLHSRPAAFVVREPRPVPVPAPAPAEAGERRGFARGYEAVRDATERVIDAGDRLGPGIFFPPLLLAAVVMIFVMRGVAFAAGAATALIDAFRD